MRVSPWHVKLHVYGRSTRAAVAASGRADGAVGVLRSLQPASKAAPSSRQDSIRSRHMVTSRCFAGGTATVGAVFPAPGLPIGFRCQRSPSGNHERARRALRTSLTLVLHSCIAGIAGENCRDPQGTPIQPPLALEG